MAERPCGALKTGFDAARQGRSDSRELRTGAAARGSRLVRGVEAPRLVNESAPGSWGAGGANRPLAKRIGNQNENVLVSDQVWQGAIAQAATVPSYWVETG